MSYIESSAQRENGDEIQCFVTVKFISNYLLRLCPSTSVVTSSSGEKICILLNSFIILDDFLRLKWIGNDLKRLLPIQIMYNFSPT